MKKICKICIILGKIILIILLAVAFNLIMMPKYINENKDGRIVAEMYREKVDPDVVFIGSSTVYSGVVPAVLYGTNGITSYVCASSSQTSWESYSVLCEFLNHYNPKLVVFDIGFMTVEDDYCEEVSNRKLYDYMHNNSVKYKGIDAAASTDESKWSYLFPVLRYHTRYNDLSLDDFKYAFFKPDVTYNGYVMTALIENELPDKLTLDNGPDISLSSKNAKYFNEIVNLCQSKNIPIMLMKTPSYQAKWGNEFEDSINTLAADNGLKYFDFDLAGDKIGIDWNSDTPDSGGHLNIYGAEKFSYYLSNVLKENYDIPDRREDVSYSLIWDEKINRYNVDKQAKITGL